MTSPDTDTQAPRTPAAQLTAWLTQLVRSHDYGQLADLRRPRTTTTAHILAASFAPTPDQRHVFEQTARLFAVYHRGAQRASYGYGSLGTAARRIGSPLARGPKDPGATRLIDRIITSRRIPWRHLQHAIERLRSCDQSPPAWSQLIDDLAQWTDRGRTVPHAWACDFHTPYANTSTKDSAK